MTDFERAKRDGQPLVAALPPIEPPTVDRAAARDVQPSGAGQTASRRAAQGPFSAFKSRQFNLLMQANLLTQAAQWMQQVTQQWLLYSLTNSPSLLGVAGFARAFPMLILSLGGGILADRFDRGRVIVWATLFATVVAGWQWWIVFDESVQPWHVLVAAALTGSALSFIQPAAQSLVPNVVDRSAVGSAVALKSAGQSAMRVIGPQIAGWLIWAVSTAFAFLTQVGCFLWAVGAALFLKAPQSPAPTGSPIDNLREAFTYIRRDSLVTGLILSAATPSLFAYGYISLLPIFARDVFNGDSGTYGFILAANGAGAMVGSTLVAVFGDRRGRGPWIVGLSLAYQAGLAAFGLSPWLPVSWVLLFICGVVGSAFNSINNAIILERAPDDLRGRVMSVYMLTWGLTPFGGLPAGILAEHIGAPWTVFWFNVVCGGALVWLYVAIPAIRRVE